MSFVMPSAAEKVGCTMAAEPRTQPSASALNLARCRAIVAHESREDIQGPDHLGGRDLLSASGSSRSGLGGDAPAESVVGFDYMLPESQLEGRCGAQQARAAG